MHIIHSYLYSSYVKSNVITLSEINNVLHPEQQNNGYRLTYILYQCLLTKDVFLSRYDHQFKLHIKCDKVLLDKQSGIQILTCIS